MYQIGSIVTWIDTDCNIYVVKQMNSSQDQDVHLEVKLYILWSARVTLIQIMNVLLMGWDIGVLMALSFGMNLESVNLRVSEYNSLWSCGDNTYPTSSIVSAASMTYYTLDTYVWTWLEPDVDGVSAFLCSV